MDLKILGFYGVDKANETTLYLLKKKKKKNNRRLFVWDCVFPRVFTSLLKRSRTFDRLYFFEVRSFIFKCGFEKGVFGAWQIVSKRI